MGLLKAFGAAATAAGQGLTQMGALKYQEEQKEEQRDWEWKKLLWADDKAVKAAASVAHRESYKILSDSIDAEIKSIDDALGGQANVTLAGYDAEYLNKRRKALADLKFKGLGMLMSASGASKEETDYLFGAFKKIIDAPPGTIPKLTEKENKVVIEANARLDASARGEAMGYGMDEGDPMLEEENPHKVGTVAHTYWNLMEGPQITKEIASTGYDFPGKAQMEGTEDNRKFIDKMWNSILASPEERSFKFFKAYTSDEEWNSIRSKIGGPEMSDDEVGKVLWDRIKGAASAGTKMVVDDFVNILKAIGGSVVREGGAATQESTVGMNAIRKLLAGMGLLSESETQEEWEGTRFEGMTPGEIEELQNQEAEQVGMIDGQTDQGLISRSTRADPNLEMRAGGEYGGGDYTETTVTDVSEPGYSEPLGDMTTTPRGETIETPPGTGEPHDVNYVEGRKAGTTNITSMTVGDIAEQYGYKTRVGMMALTYDEIIELMGKHFYKNMSEKEVRERVDSLPFGDNIQKQLLLLSLGED